MKPTVAFGERMSLRDERSLTAIHNFTSRRMWVVGIKRVRRTEGCRMPSSIFSQPAGLLQGIVPTPSPKSSRARSNGEPCPLGYVSPGTTRTHRRSLSRGDMSGIKRGGGRSGDGPCRIVLGKFRSEVYRMTGAWGGAEVEGSSTEPTWSMVAQEEGTGSRMSWEWKGRNVERVFGARGRIRNLTLLL